MSSNEEWNVSYTSGGVTWNPYASTATTTTAGPAGYPWTGTVTWPAPAAAKPKTPMATGWKCGDCGQVMAPWVASHDCPEPQAATTSTLLCKCSDCPAAGQCGDCAQD